MIPPRIKLVKCKIAAQNKINDTILRINVLLIMSTIIKYHSYSILQKMYPNQSIKRILKIQLTKIMIA
jgi:hypothetical protein